VDPVVLVSEVPGVELQQASWSSERIEYDPDAPDWDPDEDDVDGEDEDAQGEEVDGTEYRGYPG
jgi:anti-sigma factor RsiW